MSRHSQIPEPLAGELCNKCGGQLVEAESEAALIPIARCDSCGREVPRGAFPDAFVRNPEDLIEATHDLHGPFVGRVCLFSGGHDSTVLAHRCQDWYDELAFIDTGTAVPGVREFVHDFAAYMGKPLRVLEAGDAFKLMVLGGGARPSDGKPHVPLGFPGPGQHGRAYTRLKERQLEKLRADLKRGHHRWSRVLFLTGIRRAESARRANRDPVTKRGGAIFCNPLIDWTAQDMRAYRLEHDLPESDVAALIHRSGECNCGSFAAPGEREMLQSLWPEWFDRTIGALEREAQALGIPACRWGERPPKAGEQLDEGGPLCSTCAWRAEGETDQPGG